MYFLKLFTCLIGLLSFTEAAKFTNPLKNPNGSDPFIVYTGGYYYLLTTTWTDIQITRATTLNGLKSGEKKTVWTDSNSNRNGNFWAPEIQWINNRWYLYYTAGRKGTDLGYQRMHVLQGGTNVFDTYTYAAQLTPEWGIDGSVLRFPDKNYLMWSCGTPAGQGLCIATMNSPTSIGASHVLSQPTQSWERVDTPVNEGPAAMYHGGKTYIAYSASFCWTASYQLGLLTWNGGDPLNESSWTKSGPVFSSANGNYGTGHNGFFSSPDGTEIWNVFHATSTSSGNCDGGRYTMAQKVNWNSNGTPNFGAAAKLGTSISGPSGEPA